MPNPEKPDEQGGNRRDFIHDASNAAMVVGLAGGYGGLGAIALRYLYPAHGEELSWQFVTEVEKVKEGEAIRYRGPAGETINIARQGRGGGESDFIALSSTCPHLGCQVRWESQNNHFFCPCHNGVFDPAGTAIGGPPAEAGQSLAQYPLKIEGGLLHIAVPTEQLADGTENQGEILVAEGGPEGPGHDPCLCAPPRGSKPVRRG
jgi:cytochrome b6-f complex iron-sulfur subunit